MPIGLNQNKHAARVWRLLAAELGAQLRPVDGLALTLLAWHFAVAIEAAAELSQDGATADDRVHGGVKRHPANLTFRQHSGAALVLLREFGCTPASRSVIPPDDDGESLHDMLRAMVSARNREGWD